MTFTLQNYLCTLHTGQWFGFNGEHTYANLVIHSSDAKPSEADCNAGVAAMQADWDSKEYARKRKAEYDQLNQFEMQFDDKKNSTTTWVDKINEIKGRYPK